MRAALARKVIQSVCSASASLVALVLGFTQDAAADSQSLLDHINQLRINQLRAASTSPWCTPFDPSDKPLRAPHYSQASLDSPSNEPSLPELFALVQRQFDAKGFALSATLHVSPSNIANAYIRGDSEVVITSALAKETRNSSEMAFIFAHELSHVALSHAGNESIHDEIAADELALKIIEALGLNPCAGADVLDRLSAPFSASLVSVSPRLRALHDSPSVSCDGPPVG